VKKSLLFNDDLHFLDGVMAGLWEGAGPLGIDYTYGTG
jgi:hypothetical protein